MAIKCVICQNSNCKTVFKEFGIDILKCKTCGHVFSSYKQAQDYNGYYHPESLDIEKHYWWNEAHKKMYDDFCDRFIIGRSGRLLDVGCGLGYFLKKINQFSAWQTFGCEISSPAVKFANNKLGLKNIYCGKIEDSNYSPKYFDIITLWDVIEHIPNPHFLLEYLYKLLKDGGLLFLHTPNVNIQLPKAKLKKFFKGMNPNAHYLEAKDHINIYSSRTVSRLLKQHNFVKVDFVHLHPIQSVAGSKNIFLKNIKNIWFYFARAFYFVSLKKINMDNLFVAAKK